jgi:tRNA-dihydrouridine synthase 4
MSARGILNNPALFTGATSTPIDCVRRFVQLGLKHDLKPFIFHQHLIHMLEKVLSCEGF